MTERNTEMVKLCVVGDCNSSNSTGHTIHIFSRDQFTSRNCLLDLLACAIDLVETLSSTCWFSRTACTAGWMKSRTFATVGHPDVTLTMRRATRPTVTSSLGITRVHVRSRGAQPAAVRPLPAASRTNSLVSSYSEILYVAGIVTSRQWCSRHWFFLRLSSIIMHYYFCNIAAGSSSN